MPTPLDFPNSPTVGQQYAAPTGVLYAWDGAVWTAGAATTGLPPTGAAGGDLAGTYPNPTIGPGAVGNAEISDVAYGKVTGAPTIPTTLPPSGAATGDLSGTYPAPQIAAGVIVDADVSATAAIQYTKLTGVPAALPPSGAASGDLTGTYPAPTIGALKVTDAKVNDVAATKLTGTIAQARFPVAPSGLLTANVNDAQITDVKIAGMAYSKLTGAPSIPTTLPPSGTAGGSLAGSYPNPTLTTSGVTAGTYGTTAKIPQVTLTAEGRVSAVTELTVAPTGGSPSGAAGGSLAGSYPNPTVAASAIRGTPSSGGTAREIAKASIWGGDDLIDASVPDAKIAALAYSKLTGAPTSLPPSGAAGGDLAGTYPNPTLKAGVVPLTVQARVVSTVAQSIPNGAETVLTFDTIITNAGGAYSAGSPDRFTIPTAGFYIVGGSLQHGASAVGTWRQLLLYVGANPLTRFVVSPGAYTALVVAAASPFSVNDVVQLKAYQDSGGALSTQGGSLTTFWLARVA